MKLETSHGTYEADTLNEVRRLARAGERKQAELFKAQAAARELAVLRARSAAYMVLSHKLVEGREFPKGWRYAAVDAPNWCTKRMAGEHSRSFKVEVEAMHGRVTNDFYGVRVLGSVENGAGFCIALVIQDGDKPAEVYAVGAEADQLAIELIPTVNAEDFNPRKEVRPC